MTAAPLLSVRDLAKAYGATLLFTDLALTLAEGDRVGLVGPNGSGKSTLLRILAGLETPDSGARSLRRGSRLGYVPQDPAFPADETVERVVAGAVAEAGDPALAEPGAGALRVAMTLSRAGFVDPRAAVGDLSGGWRKRLAIARELARRPDVLLMDEPTNHLDVDGILWLEELLRGETAAYLAVSHDRWFLEHVAERMVELDRIHPAGLFESRGRYSDFLVARDEALRAAGRIPGDARQSRPARDRMAATGRQGPDDQAAGAHQGGGAAGRRAGGGKSRAVSARAASTSPRPTGGVAASSSPRTSPSRWAGGPSCDDLDLVLGPRHADRPPRPQRQRKVHADPPPHRELAPDRGAIERADA